MKSGGRFASPGSWPLRRHTACSFFWPVFPMLFLGLNLVKTVVQRESVIEREVLRLEERAAQDTAPELPAGRGDPDEAREG